MVHFFSFLDYDESNFSTFYGPYFLKSKMVLIDYEINCCPNLNIVYYICQELLKWDFYL